MSRVCTDVEAASGSFRQAYLTHLGGSDAGSIHCFEEFKKRREERKTEACRIRDCIGEDCLITFFSVLS